MWNSGLVNQARAVAVGIGRVLRDIYFCQSWIGQQVAGGKGDDLISAAHRPVNGLVKAVNHARGIAGTAGRNTAFCSTLRRISPRRANSVSVVEAAAKPLFRPGAAGGEQGGQGGEGEKEVTFRIRCLLLVSAYAEIAVCKARFIFRAPRVFRPAIPNTRRSRR